jgi:hypothetical protein
LTDTKQNQAFNLDSLGQQFVHLATTLGNAKSFMTPHYNEVILPWLRANDANYQDYASADSAQKAGYRRVYVEKIPGVDVTGTVRDSKGNVVAVFKNGELLSTTSKWIGMTTSDSGNWLRLPVNDTYRIDFEVSKDTVLNVKVSEYSVENGHEVRTETSDAKYDWKNFALRTVDSASLVISAVAQQAGEYGGYDARRALDDDYGCCFVRGRMHDILEKEKICRNNIKEGRIYVSNQRKKRSGLPCTALYDGCVSSGTCHEGRPCSCRGKGLFV